MNIRWTHLLIPLACAGLAWAWVSIAFWDAAKPSLLVTLSVIAAGVLLRLARGLPFANPDQFELNEVRTIAKAMKASIRALRALIFAVFATMGALVFAPTAATKIKSAVSLWPKIEMYVEPLFSALIALLLTYVFVRIYAVIQGDVALVDKQATLLERAVERKQGENFEKTIAASAAHRVESPKGYGTIIQ